MLIDDDDISPGADQSLGVPLFLINPPSISAEVLNWHVLAVGSVTNGCCRTSDVLRLYIR